MRMPVADDHRLVRLGMASLPWTQPDTRLMGQAVGGDQAA
jgi:hypothetical protein